MLKRIAMSLLAIVACCLCLEAQEVSSVPQIKEIDTLQYLENVIVYGRKPYAEVIPAQTLGGKKLEGLNSHSIADAIRYFSGVQVKDYGGVGGIKTIDIRSMGTNHLGVFYDGIQLGNAQNGQIDLGRFSLDNIEEISLYNGQKSEIFQPARDYGSAGTVYIKTRRPKFSGEKNNNFNVTMRTGSFGLANPSLRWEHRFSRNVSMSLNAEYTYATGQYHFRYRKKFSDGTIAWDTTAVRKNGDVQALRVEGAVFGAIEDGKWNAKFYYYDSERGIPGAIVNNVWMNSQRQWDRNFFAQGSWQKRLSEKFEMMVNAKYARDFMHYHNPDTTLMLVDNKFWQDEIYISSANKYTILPDWDVNLSVDYKWNYLNSTLTNFSYPQRHTALVALATARTWHRFKCQASLLYTMIDDRYKTIYQGQTLARHSKWMHKFTPAVFMNYQPIQRYDFYLRAFYKRIFRMPTFNDLFYTDMGNANLRPEYANQFDLGFWYQRLREDGFFTGLKFTADAYYNTITDKIIAVPSGRGQYRWTMMNIGKVRIMGVDVTARATMHLARDFNVDINLSYTYQKARDYTDPEDTGFGGTYKGQIAYIPWHSGSVVGRATWRDLDVNYSFIYVGERYSSSCNERSYHQPPWYTHDLSASYTFTLGSTKFKVAAEVNNLFNQYYDVIINYPMPGRNYKLILKFDF